MHGDFAPWNLRRILRGPLALFDFEDARYAPPEADRTYWRLTSAVLQGRTPGLLDPESRQYWREVVAARLAQAADPTLDQRLLAALDSPGLDSPGLNSSGEPTERTR
jgi:aminoglycoside phosphotransferase (APT) family kinase protein